MVPIVCTQGSSQEPSPERSSENCHMHVSCCPAMHTKSALKGVCITAVMFITALSRIAAHAETINVAVASNFAGTARELAAAFERESGNKIILSTASTGKLYAQIMHGAPFELFLSADATRPERLVADRMADSSTLNTYAIGQLLMVSQIADTNGDCKDSLLSSSVTHIAIADPTIAPYGKAAMDTLNALSPWKAVSLKLVRGENIAQTLHFYITGNAQVAFIAQSQASSLNHETRCRWPVPSSLHSPIEQKMVALKGASLEAHAFAAFIMSSAAREIIQRHG